jgi:hypothetical protein
VPAIHQTAEIEVRASPSAAFAVVAGDILAVSDDPDAMARHRPLDAGPLREGFRWQQTIVHDRLFCRSDWVVMELREARMLEQTFPIYAPSRSGWWTGGSAGSSANATTARPA